MKMSLSLRGYEDGVTVSTTQIVLELIKHFLYSLENGKLYRVGTQNVQQ